MRDVVGGTVHAAAVRQAREPRIEDLLGRSTVSTDLGAVRRSLKDLRVLITGAGGSIGSEIARQVMDFGPAQLLLLDHDETHLHDVAGALPGPCEQLLVDIADRPAVFEVLLRYRPDVVFHAAAHKHVPVLESHPIEAVNVNVYGTLNVVEAAAAAGTTRFVCISTDKAVEPISVMGASKRLAEQVVLGHAPPGSAYSVGALRQRPRQPGQRDPDLRPPDRRRWAADCHRSPHDAVLHERRGGGAAGAAGIGALAQSGEIFMLEMGEPVRILDLAERMIRLSGHEAGTDIPIRMIGRRPGEKLHEELHSPEEVAFSTSHPFIRRLAPADPPTEGSTRACSPCATPWPGATAHWCATSSSP